MSWTPVPGTGQAMFAAHLPSKALEGIEGWRYHFVQGKPITTVPHTPEVWGNLRSKGLLLAPPMGSYPWPGVFEPMSHQRLTVQFLVQHEKAFCLNGLRTGKTISALWAADFLRRAGLVRRVLIVAPLFICDIVWERAIFQSFPKDRAVLVRGVSKQKVQIASDTRFPYIIVNPESLHLIVDHLKEVDLIIVDEYTRFKSVRVGSRPSVRYQALQAASAKRRLWMLSGTPNPQNPTDAYGPIRLVNPKPLGLVQFREMTMMQLSEHKWVPRIGAANVVAEWLTPAIRFSREDCIDIPDVEVSDLEVELTKAQQKALLTLKEEAMAMMEDGTEILAPHAAACLMKMLQVMAGGVYGDDPNGERATYKVDATPILEALEEQVREDDGPVIIFASYQCSVDAIAEYLASKGLRVGKRTRGVSDLLHKGEVTRLKSMEIFDAHERGELDALVAIPQTMQFGLELVRGRTVIWATPPFSFEAYDQANARVQSAAQKRKVIIRHVVQNPLASMLFRRLESKEALQKEVLDLVQARNPETSYG
jgi:hypothetical protein